MTSSSEIHLKVSGMTCASCARHVDHALRTLEGVTDVRVSVREGRALVRHDGTLELEPMLEALRDAGYEGEPIA